MEHDAYSGDFGLGFFGLSLEASATLVLHPQRGPLCFLCDLSTGAADAPLTVLPRDAYRQRVYLEPLGLYLRADTGVLAAVTLHRAAQRVTVSFAPPTATPAGTRTYDVLRLRADKVSQPEARRPGANFRLVEPTAGVVRARGAWELPASEDAVTAVLAYDEGPVVES